MIGILRQEDYVSNYRVSINVIQIFNFFFSILILANKQSIYKYSVGDSVPNKAAIGLTVDRCGYVYSAVYNGGEVLKICPKQVNFYKKKMLN